MEIFFSSLLSFLLLYKYITLFLVSFLAAFLLPLPSSTLLSASGAFASQGYFNFAAVLLVALTGNIGGDLVGYFLARRYGKELLHKWGFGHIIGSHWYNELELYIHEFSYSIIFLTRFLPEIGPAVNILAGLGKMSFKKFLVWDIIGEIAYVSLYGFVGYFLGTQWENNINYLIRAGAVIFSIGGTIALIQYYYFKKGEYRKY